MNIREFLRDLLGACMLPLVAFVIIPATLYLANQSDFDFNRALLAQGLALGIVVVALIAFVLACVGPRVRPRAAAILFGLGVYLALSDILLPVRLGALTGVPLSEPLPEPWTKDAADVVLLFAALAAGALLPIAWLRRTAPILVVVLSLSEAVTVARGFRQDRLQRNRESGRLPPPTVVHPGGNVYVITFDGFSAIDFLDRLRQTGLESEFTGFTWFPEHRSNYLQTFVSMASYTTGTLYTEGSLSAWVYAARLTGILKELREVGYAVTTYLPFRGWVHQSASYVMLQAKLQSGDWVESSRQFWALVVLHGAPHYLHQETYAALLSEGETTPVRAVAMMRRMIADEPSRPSTGQFIQAHILIPHEPFLLNSHAEFSPGGGYADQAEAALYVLGELVAELKRLERYENALIIVNSDHGWDSIGPASLEGHGLGADVVASLRAKEAATPEFDARVALNRSRALLMVKAPHNHAPFRVAEGHLTQNLDLPATIYDALQLPIRAPDGQSVLGAAPPPSLAVQIFTGFQRGFSIDTFQHFTYCTESGLTVAADVPLFSLIIRPSVFNQGSTDHDS